MIDLLHELEEELNRSVPRIAGLLLPGLPPDRIEAMLAGMPQPVPADVKTLYSWHDGADTDFGAYRAELFRGGMFLPLHEALQCRDAVIDQTDGDSGRTWLPLFMDEHHLFEAVVCGPGGGELVHFSYLDLPSFDHDYPSLRAFISSLIQRWRTGVYRADDAGGVYLDVRALASLRREEDGDAVDVASLVNDLVSSDEEVMIAALHRLRSRLYPAAVPALVAALEDPDTHKYYLIELLGAIGDPAALPALDRTAASDHTDRFRAYAAKAANAIRTGEEFF